MTRKNPENIIQDIVSWFQSETHFRSHKINYLCVFLFFLSYFLMKMIFSSIIEENNILIKVYN
jgi:hypothetical protein